MSKKKKRAQQRQKQRANRTIHTSEERKKLVKKWLEKKKKRGEHITRYIVRTKNASVKPRSNRGRFLEPNDVGSKLQKGEKILWYGQDFKLDRPNRGCNPTIGDINIDVHQVGRQLREGKVIRWGTQKLRLINKPEPEPMPEPEPKPKPKPKSQPHQPETQPYYLMMPLYLRYVRQVEFTSFPTLVESHDAWTNSNQYMGRARNCTPLPSSPRKETLEFNIDERLEHISPPPEEEKPGKKQKPYT